MTDAPYPTCAVCTSRLREVRPGVFVHQVERTVTRKPYQGTLDFRITETVPGIDYVQVETICKEVKP